MEPDAETALGHYLDGAGADPPTEVPRSLWEQAAAARAFVLGDTAPPRALDVGVGRVLCEVLAQRADADRLVRLAREGERGLAKEARRVLHVLRSQGASVAIPRPAVRVEPALTRADAEPEIVSILSMIDSRGERAVWLCRRDPAGGVRVFQTVLSDSRGLVEFVGGSATRKGYRQLVKDLTTRDDVTAAVVPTSYARWLVEEAYQRTQRAGRALPAGFAAARPELGAAEAPAAHPALAAYGGAEPLDETELGELLESRELRGWIPDEETLRRVALKLAEIDESRLLVNERQKREAMSDVLAREVAAYWTAERRELYRRRLLDMAFLLHLVPGRDDDGRRLRAAAEAFGPRDAAAAANAFERRLFERALNVAPAAAAEEEPAAPGGLIVSPYGRPPDR